MPPGDLILHHAGGQITGLSSPAAAAWCWENMEDRDTVTIFRMMAEGEKAQQACSISRRDGKWKMHCTHGLPEWFVELRELVE